MKSIGIRCECNHFVGAGHLARQKLIHKALKPYANINFLDNTPNIPPNDIVIFDMFNTRDIHVGDYKLIIFYDGSEPIKIKADAIFASNLTQKSQKNYYAGGHYFPIDNNIKPFKRSPGKNILIMTSKVDNWNIPQQIFEAIKHMGYNIKIRSSANYVHHPTLPLVGHVDCINDLYTWANVMISTAGNVLYEAAAAALPTISFSVNLTQEKHGINFENANISKYFGGFWNNTAEVNKLPIYLEKLGDKEFYAKMSIKGPTICDGKGLFRITSIIKELLN